MRGQSGVGTIIVFIATILVGVIAAIVFLQVTNSLRSQALLTQRQAEETMSSHYLIDSVEGIAFKDTNSGLYKLYYILLRVKVGYGADTLSLRKTLLTFSGGGATIPGARYAPVHKTIRENSQSIAGRLDKNAEEINSWASTLTDACSAELYDIMSYLGKYDYKELVRLIAPARGGDINRPDFSRFTVVWEDCDDKHDVHSLYDGQTAYVIYPLPVPLQSHDYFKIDLHTSKGWTSPLTLRVPAGLDRGYVIIYPTG